MVHKKLLNNDCLVFVENKWKDKFKSLKSLNIDIDSLFEKTKENYIKLKPFDPDGNIWESGQQIDEYTHFFMRMVTQYYVTLSFNAMLIDMNNVNVAEDNDSGNIGTPGRIAKMWCSSSIDDNTELLSGRWIKEPRMASFKDKNEPVENLRNDEIVWVETQIRAVCSHHFIGFHNNPQDIDSFVVVGYRVKDGVRGGISKISRYVRDFASRRAWLQESLTTYIGKKIEDKFQTDSVYVALVKINHGCSWTRGANDQDAATTTVYKSGIFIEKPELIPEKYKR